MVNFYRDVLELTIVYPQIEDYSDQTYVAFGTGTVIFALHSGKETSEVPTDAPKYNFEVINIQKTRQNLLDKGVKMNEITNATPTKLICSGRDPEGNGFFIETTSD